jgi:probable rRNA maturation factor
VLARALLLVLLVCRLRAFDLIIIRQTVDGLTAAGLGLFVARVRRELGISREANILVAGNGELRQLNRRFRGKDQPTDVLSFPALRGAKAGLAGEIAISATIAAANARRLGHSPALEIKVLALHGLLHLAGFDHETDNGEMARKERTLRTQLKLPASLIARAKASAKMGSES